MCGIADDRTGGSKPSPRRDRRRGQRLACGLVGGEQVGGRGAGPAGCNQLFPQRIRASVQRPNRVGVIIADDDRPPHLADIPVGECAGGQRDEVARPHPAVVVGASPGMVARGHPRGVLAGGCRHAARRHRPEHGSRDCPLGRSRRHLRDARAESRLGDTHRRGHRDEFLGRFDPARGPHGGLAVDEFGVRKGQRQQLGERRGDRVGPHPPSGARPVHVPENVDELQRIPSQAVEVVVVDLLGHTLVGRAVQVDLAGGAVEHADRPERAGARDPQLRNAGDVADVGLTAQHQHVQAVGPHLGQGAVAPRRAERPVIGPDLRNHRGRRGSR